LVLEGKNLLRALALLGAPIMVLAGTLNRRFQNYPQRRIKACAAVALYPGRRLLASLGAIFRDQHASAYAWPNNRAGYSSKLSATEDRPSIHLQYCNINVMMRMAG